MAAIMQWCHIPAVQDGAVDLEHRLPGEPGKLTEKHPVEAEEDPQTLGDREHELSVGDGGAQITGDVLLPTRPRPRRWPTRQRQSC